MLEVDNEENQNKRDTGGNEVVLIEREMTKTNSSGDTTG